MEKSKVSFYIDGFNIYHRINEYQKKTGICYKWLNYRSLFISLLKPFEEISDIYFFTAITQDFGLDSVQRHNKYITALESQGIKIVKGYFSKKKKLCRVQDCNFKGNKYFDVREEKQTDVNISLFLLKDAYLKKYDKCFLVSGDNDFAPVLRTIKDLFNINPFLITPPYEYGIVNLKPIKNLKSACFDRKRQKFNVINLQFNNFIGHSFSEKIYDASGKLIVEMPKEYSKF
ncbi:MAG: NYN domain-containing protein [Actinobacteria bacterium]|nr:NYN domain-containing protein [Cyanobacteriota bacterium]MCL5771945.1 NYN domain-containing protein [Actinomycetota bacterium]